MKQNEINEQFGDKKVCANCDHYRYDETCGLNGLEMPPEDSCDRFFKRVEFNYKVAIPIVATAIGALAFYLA